MVGRSRAEVLDALKRTEKDERLWYKTATTFENAPLALVQVSLEIRSDVLRWVLGFPNRPKTQEELEY